jgi:hypothetical protein
LPDIGIASGRVIGIQDGERVSKAGEFRDERLAKLAELGKGVRPLERLVVRQEECLERLLDGLLAPEAGLTKEKCPS